MVRRAIISVLLLGLLLGVAACQGRVSTVELAATVTLPATELAAQPTEPPTRVPSTEVVPTATALPPTATATTIPSDTPSPTSVPSDTPAPTSAAPFLTATAKHDATQVAAQVAAGVDATLEALPSATAYPTYTVVPSETPVPTLAPTDTPLPTLTPTVDLEGTRAADEAAHAEAATTVAEAVEATLTAWPTATFTPTPVPPTATPSDTPTPVPPTATPSDTPTPVPLTATPSNTPTPVPPTATPSNTPTPVPPTATPSNTPTPVPPSPTVLVPPILSTAEVPTATRPPVDPLATATALAATQMSVEATDVAVAGATQTQTALDLRATEIAAAFTETPLPTPTIGFEATATALVAAVTATAEAIAAQPLGLVFDVPEGWSAPVQTDLNTLQLSDESALIFLYRGDATFFETWGIPAGETDLVAAAGALARRTGGTIQPYEGKAAIPVLLPGVREGKRGVLYLAKLAEGDWLLLSGSAPADDLATYQAEVFEPLLLSLEVTGAEPTPATPPPMRTPQPTRTPIVIPPTLTPTPAPLTLVSTRSAALGLTFDAPEGWTETMPPALNPPDVPVAGAIFYASAEDAAHPSGRVGHPALLVLRVTPGEYALAMDGTTAADLLSGLFMVPEQYIQSLADAHPAARAVVARPGGAAVVHALALGADDWAVVSVVAPPGYNALELEQEVLVPLVRSLALSEE